MTTANILLCCCLINAKERKHRNTRIGSAYYKSLYADEFPHAKVSECVCVCMFECLLTQAGARVCVCVTESLCSRPTRPSPKLFMLIRPARWKALPLHFLYIFPINIKHYYNEMGFSSSRPPCVQTHTHTHTPLVFHLVFLALFSLAYLWLSEQEMGMQNTADGIRRTSLVCEFILSRRCVLRWRRRP